jgi:TIR domain
VGVFICWSGTNSRSHRLAEILRDRIPDILQTAEPFVSDVDVGAGAPWMNQLTKALEEKRFGILCITPENQENPWIHFEAGALWKADEERRVCPLLYDIRPAEISGPLSQLQAKQFSKSGFLAVMKEVNRRGCSFSIEERVLERTFERVWSEIEAEVSKIKVPAVPLKKTRDSREMIEEILTIVRSLQCARQEEKESAKYEAIQAAIRRVLSSGAVPEGGYPPSSLSTLITGSPVNLDSLKPIYGRDSSDETDKNTKS